MSIGHRGEHHLEEPSAALRRLITPQVRQEIEQLIEHATVDHSYDVLWMGGRTRDLARVDVDRSLPKMIAGVDTGEGLKRHEVPEGYLQNVLGLAYWPAHNLATFEFEKPWIVARVGEAGWKRWQDTFGQRAGRNEHERIREPDPKADLSPYLSAGTKSEIAKMTTGGMPQPTGNVPQGPEQGAALAPQNPLMGQATGQSDDSSAGGAPPPLQVGGLAQVRQQHTQLAEANKKLKSADATLKKVRTGLDSLMLLGDMATQDDVVKVAGDLVAHGLEPSAMAAMLAEMPEGGEGLRGWIAQHDAQIRQREAQQAQVHAIVRHELATSALRSLVGQHAIDGHAALQQPQAPAPAQGPAGVSPAGVGGNPLGAGQMEQANG